MSHSEIAFLTELESVIRARAAESAEQSYTAGLMQSGTRRVAQKVGEEAIELALASVAGNRDEQLNEAADLVYHLLVLLACNGIGLADVVAVLTARHQQ